MEIEGYEVTLFNGFYSVTLGNKTYVRAKLSNLETIIHMYDQGGDLRARVDELVPEQRTEWVASHAEETLATGNIIDVVTHTPVHPEREDFAFDAYEMVPEYGKGVKAVRKRATEAHEAKYQDKTAIDNLIVGFHAGLGKIRMPSMPRISLFGKGVGTVLVVFVMGIFALVAIGYSGLGKRKD